MAASFPMGARQVTFADIVDVSIKHTQVAVDKAVIEKLPAAAVSTSKMLSNEELRAFFASKIGQSNGAAASLAPHLVRAAMVLRAVTLLPAVSGVSRPVVSRIVSLLNAEITPEIPAVSSPDVCYAAAFGARLYAGTAGSFQADAGKAKLSTADAMKRAAIPESISLTEAEAIALTQGDCFSVGRLCIAQEYARSLKLLTDCVVALVTEATGIPKACFDPALFENCRPHAGAIQCVKNLRALLDDSKIEGAKPELIAKLGPKMAQIAYISGGLSDAVDALSKAVKIEIRAKPVDIPAAPAPSVNPGGDKKKAKGAEEGAAASAPDNSKKVYMAGVAHLSGATLGSPSLGLLQAATALASALVEIADALPVEVVGQQKAEIQKIKADIEKELKVPCYILPSTGLAPVLTQTEKMLALLHQLTLTLGSSALVALAVQEDELNAKIAAKTGGTVARKKLNVGKGVEQLINGLVEKAAASGLTSGAQFKKTYGGLDLASMAAKLEEGVQPRNQVTRRPKLPKGTLDFTPVKMAIREQAFRVITSVFKKHGAVQIDTPVFELKETLMGKYGEDQKLIYDLKDQGGEQLSLRYDLTVPFARYVATQNTEKIKRFHIGKVYRRDEPQMNRGRFREFYQCDFDIAGVYDPMLPDADALGVLSEILTTLNIGKFTIKLNHRMLLDAMMTVCGVPPEKHRPICSAIDKLDKEPWEAVKIEMTQLKGLPVAVADRIGTYVLHKGKPQDMLKTLATFTELNKNDKFKKAVEELTLLVGYLEALGCVDKFSIDMSLARGLDYYTGVIFEAVTDSGVGSVAAGGRYDGLVGMFLGKNVPAVGCSVGVERVFALLETRFGLNEVAPEAAAPAEGDKKKKDKKNAKKEEATAPVKNDESCVIRSNVTDVLVCTVGDSNELTTKRLRLTTLLRSKGIATEFLFKTKMHPKKQLDAAAESRIPILVMIGDDELAKGTVKIRLVTQDGGEKERDRADLEKEVPEAELLPHIQAILAATGTSADQMYAQVVGGSTAAPIASLAAIGNGNHAPVAAAPSAVVTASAPAVGGSSVPSLAVAKDASTSLWNAIKP